MAKTKNGGEGKTLVATYPILHRSYQYEIGESLPLDDQEMVEAWLKCGSAKWVGEAKAEPTKDAEPEVKVNDTEPEAKANDTEPEAKTNDTDNDTEPEVKETKASRKKKE